MEISAEEEFLLSDFATKQDESALKILTDKYGPPLYGFLRALWPGKQSQKRLEQVMAQAFVQAIHSIKPLQVKEPFLLPLLRQTARQLKNQQAPTAAIPLNLEGLDSRLSLLVESLSLLPAEERILILLRDQFDLSHTEITDVLSISKDNLKNELNDARIHFRERLTHVLSRREAGGHAM